MKEFFARNRLFITIIIAAFIIGGFIFAGLNYFANKTAGSLASLIEVIGTSGKIVSIESEAITQEGERDLTSKEAQKEIKKDSTSQCIDYTEAPAHIGEHRCVTGRVNHVYTSPKGNIFLNFCADYQTCPFVGVIFSSEAYKFPGIQNYKGRTVEITGLLTSYKGRPEIIIDDPTQIEVR